MSQARDEEPTTSGSAKKTMKYVVTKTIGKGAFGVVYLAREEKTGTVFAIKETFQDPNYKNREAEIVKALEHPNIIKIHHVFFSKKQKGVYLHLVMDCLPSNLFDYIQKLKRGGQVFETDRIMHSMYQICRGLGHMHSKGICHRDIKPHNILIDPDLNRVVVCDFGSAKILVEHEWNKTYICSRFYRAPELLFQSNYYTTAVDVWSAGCVLGEMFRLSPLFAGADTEGQIRSIAEVLGNVGRDHIKVFRLESGRKIPAKTVDWSTVLARSDRNVIVPPAHAKLLSDIITYDCVGRVTAFDALKHEMFDGIRDAIQAGDATEERFMYQVMTDSEKKRAETAGWDSKYIL